MHKYILHLHQAIAASAELWDIFSQTSGIVFPSGTRFAYVRVILQPVWTEGTTTAFNNTTVHMHILLYSTVFRQT